MNRPFFRLEGPGQPVESNPWEETCLPPRYARHSCAAARFGSIASRDLIYSAPDADTRSV
jgi:hypothetical protein